MTIYAELTMLLLIAACISAAAFSVMDIASEYFITQYLDVTDYAEKIERKQAEDLQEYVMEHEISSGDIEEVEEWAKSQGNTTIQVFRNGLIIYDSYYPEDVGTWEITDESYYEREGSYKIQLEDGPVYVSIYGFHVFRFYEYAFLMELLLSSLLFIAIVLGGIQKKIRYIRKLHEEIKVLEGGALDYEITIEGKDELAELAGGLDAMRQSLKEQMEEETRLMQEHRKLITEMSHDLRTPLTSLLIYTEILKKNGVEDPEQMLSYIDKINLKAHQLKVMSDHIFEYSLVSREPEIELDEPEAVGVVFFDLLSEMAAYLEQQGYVVEKELSWKDAKICVSQEYLNRVLDNIVSNIIKYADHEMPVRIVSVESDEAAGIRFSNQIGAHKADAQSTRIGLRSLENLMRKMNGWSLAKKEGAEFQLELWFQKTMEEVKDESYGNV